MTRFLFFIDSLSLGRQGVRLADPGADVRRQLRGVRALRACARRPPGPSTLSYIIYGALFLMAGAYTLSRNGHVRADVLYRLWPPRTQASMDLVLYIMFFFPACWR